MKWKRFFSIVCCLALLAALLPAPVRAADPVYTVTLDPGEGSGTPVTYRSDQSTIVTNVNDLQNFQFYHYIDTWAFGLNADYLPESFAPPKYYEFNGWGKTGNVINLTSENTVLKPVWSAGPLPTGGPIADLPVKDGGSVYVNGKRWHIVGEKDASWLLHSASLLGTAKNWTNANNECNTLYNGFSDLEKNAVLPVTKASDDDVYNRFINSKYFRNENYMNGPALNQAKIFFLSIMEADYYLEKDAQRLPGDYWLRASGEISTYSGSATGAGFMDSNGALGKTYATALKGIRPALVFDRSNILFESAAANGKPKADGNLAAYTVPGTSVDRKLTLYDSSRNGFSANVSGAGSVTSAPGESIEISYSGAQTGENECVSVMLCDADGNTDYYGSLTADSTGSGTWNLTLPVLSEGTYTLKVFSEQQNGDYNTDYAGQPVSLSLTISNSSPRTYIDADGNAQICTESSSVGYGTTWSNGWYRLDDDITVYDRINVNGDVHLILCDGHTLNAKAGISVLEGNSLTIYGQRLGTGTLNATAKDQGAAGIGGLVDNGWPKVGAITINGGIVNAKGYDDDGNLSGTGAGIGGGSERGCGTVTINGGKVTAYGSRNGQANGAGGAGIGSGFNSYAADNTIIINGGNVKAYAYGNGKAPGIGTYARNDGAANISLSWRNPSDSIYATSYINGCKNNNSSHNVNMKKDFVFASGDGYTQATSGNAGGQTLLPAWKVTVDNSLENGSVTCERTAARNGETLTIKVVPNQGYKCSNLTVKTQGSDVGATQVDEQSYTFEMPEADVSVTAEFTETAPEFKSHTLLLSGQIGVNFYADLSMLTDEEKQAVTMDFTVNGKKKTANFDPDFTNPGGNGYYGFTCYINSVQMADKITAELHYTQNGEAKTVSKTYSAKQYINAVLEKEDSYSSNTLALVKAIANYGHYVQPFLAEHNNWRLGMDHDEMAKVGSYSDEDISNTKTAVADNAFSWSAGKSQIEKVTYSLNLESETAIRIYLTVKEGYEGPVTAKIGEEDVPCEKRSDGRYRIEIGGISAHKLGDTYNITVSAGGDGTISVSPLSYVRAVLNSDSNDPIFGTERAKYAVVSIYNYYKAAINYKANPNG